MSKALKIGVLLSGNGSNLQAIIDAINAEKLKAHIVQVISSKPDAYGLTRAQQAGIPTCSLSKETYQNPSLANEVIATEFVKAGAEYIVMAGYMRKVTEEILSVFPDRVINIHPALLPAFIGPHAIEDAYHAGVKLTGVTVHFANAEYDKGPIIAQRSVAICEDDSLEDLEKRIHKVEHELYPEVLNLIAQKRVFVDENRRVKIMQ